MQQILLKEKGELQIVIKIYNKAPCFLLNCTRGIGCRLSCVVKASFSEDGVDL